MKLFHPKLILAALLACAPLVSLADCKTSVRQTPDLIEKLNSYYASGEYIKELEKKTIEAKNYLDRRLGQGGEEKLAIVLDIDETALSNVEALRRNHYSTNMQAFTANYLFTKLPSIGPTLGLFHYAKRRGVDVFFVTSRPNVPEVINATVANLKQAGYSDWKELYLKPIEDNTLSSATFKKSMRQKIQDMGYTIVLNIGDQQSDVAGGLAELAVKYPNPFYLNVPDGSVFG